MTEQERMIELARQLREEWAKSAHLESELARERGRRQSAEEMSRLVSADLKDARARIAELEARLEKIEGQNAALVRDNDEGTHVGQIDLLVKERANLNKKLIGQQDQIMASQLKISALRATLHCADDERIKAENERDEARRQLDKLPILPRRRGLPLAGNEFVPLSALRRMAHVGYRGSFSAGVFVGQPSCCRNVAYDDCTATKGPGFAVEGVKP